MNRQTGCYVSSRRIGVDPLQSLGVASLLKVTVRRIVRMGHDFGANGVLVRWQEEL